MAFNHKNELLEFLNTLCEHDLYRVTKLKKELKTIAEIRERSQETKNKSYDIDTINACNNFIDLIFESAESKCFDVISNTYPGITNISTKIYEKASKTELHEIEKRQKIYTDLIKLISNINKKEELNISDDDVLIKKHTPNIYDNAHV